MAKYESVAVFSVKQGEERAKELLEKFKALIDANRTDKTEEPAPAQEPAAPAEPAEPAEPIEGEAAESEPAAESAKKDSWVNVWGKRQLAYPINYETEGYYVVYTFEADVDFPAELDRLYDITDGVLRWLTVVRPE